MSARIAAESFEMNRWELAMRDAKRGLACISAIGILGWTCAAAAQAPDVSASSAVPHFAAPLADGRAGVASLAGAASAPRSSAVNVVSPGTESSARLAPSSVNPGSSASVASSVTQPNHVISSPAPRFDTATGASSAAPSAPAPPANGAIHLAGVAPASAATAVYTASAGTHSAMAAGVTSASASPAVVSSATAAASLPKPPAVGLITRPE
jgi:hypothetical protein